MTQEEAFLQAILEFPDDDTPRLIYSDWLEEHGQEERAELIRVQIELAKVPVISDVCRAAPTPCYRCEDCLRWTELRRRDHVLLSRHEGEWLDWLKVAWGSEWVPVRECGVEWRRGFVEQINCSGENWLVHADALIQAAPLRKVELTTPMTGMDWYGRGANTSKVDDRVWLTAGVHERECQRAKWGCWWGKEPPVLARILEVEWPRIRFTLPEER